MIFNGHLPETIDKIDEETFSEICVMFADGILGNKGTFDALTPITTALFNYIRPANSPTYKANQIFPWIVEYEKNPDLEPPEKDKANDALLLFLTQAPGFTMEKVNGIQRNVAS